MSERDVEEMLKKAMFQKTDPRFRNTEEILTEDDRKIVETVKKEVKKRRCANCTCSRSNESVSDCKPSPAPKVKSGCGSCYKGDAFRCSGCPYYGMPAFEEGTEFQFKDDMNDL